MQLFIKTSNDNKQSITVDDQNMTIESVKQLIQQASNIPADQQRLIYSGKVLKDTDTVTTCGLKDGHTLHVVRGASKTSSIPSTGTFTNTSINSNTSANTTTASPRESPIPPFGAPFMMSPPGLDPAAMQAMLSDPEMIRQATQFMNQHPEFVQMAMNMASMQTQQPTNNPQASMMNSMMSNPALLQSMMQSAFPQQQPQISQEPPEVRFQNQLVQLNEMGFYDADANIRALLATGGNVNAAVERLLSSMQ